MIKLFNMINGNQAGKNILKKWWFWGIIVFVFFILTIGNSAPTKNQDTNYSQVLQPEIEEVVGAQETNTTPEQLLTPKEGGKTEEKIYSVVKVVDGDTISVNINGITETIRLIGINTPETVDPRKPVECFGIEASNKAKELLTGKKVILESDPTEGERDKYQRLLRYVWMEDGTFFNKKMISDGYAYEYTYDTPYKYQAEFKQAETEARLAKRGLWDDDACSEESQMQPPNIEDQGAVDTSSIICSSNTYNCTDFKTHTEAQQVFEFCGGINNDIHKWHGAQCQLATNLIYRHPSRFEL